MSERYEGYGQSIRRIMEQKKDNPGLLGVVADIIQVEKKFETAVETALGGNIQNIVTEDEQVAKKNDWYIKEKSLWKGNISAIDYSHTKNRKKLSEENCCSEEGVRERCLPMFPEMQNMTKL